jgi:hypothetical protein
LFGRARDLYGGLNLALDSWFFLCVLCGESPFLRFGPLQKNNTFPPANEKTAVFIN